MSTKKPCDCCEAPCKIFEYASPESGVFDFIGGSWSYSGSGLYESTGSGLALAKAHTDGAGTEMLFAGVDDPKLYDLVFDYIDPDNYQVLKWRNGAVASPPRFARVASGVETDLYTAAAPSPSINFYTFVRNSSPAWAVTTSAGGGTLYDELPQYGGTRFGFRSNSGGVTYNRINRLQCHNTVDVAIDDVTPTPSAFGVYGDVARPDCLVNPQPVRCEKCIALAPRSGEAQWVATVAGVTGNCAGLLNGTHIIDCNGCTSGLYNNGVNCSPRVRDVWVNVLMGKYYGGPVTGNIEASLLLIGVDPSLGARRAFFPITNTTKLNCYTDFPQTLGPATVTDPAYSSAWDPADADFSSATATLDLVY